MSFTPMEKYEYSTTGKIHIWEYSLFNPVDITLKNARIVKSDNGTYLYTDSKTFYVHTE